MSIISQQQVFNMLFWKDIRNILYLKTFIGLQSEHNIVSNLIIQFGHYYLNINLGGYGVSQQYSITLPIAMKYYVGFGIPRNVYEVDCGINQPNLTQMNFQLHNNSANTRNVYGVYWFVIGY